MKYARMSRTGARKFLAPARPSYYQNCAVRVTYISSRVKGHWRAHGRYLSRESASLEPEKAGFGPVQDKLDIASTVHEWQSKSDPRLWKLILSPEFGDRVDLQKLTRKVMTEVEADLNTALEWVAVAHFNTDHPHVHIALRGIDKKGLEFKLPRDYVKSGLRAVAQHAVTAQLGYRTEQDAVLAYQQQIPEQRLTPLDRIILQRMESAPLEDAVARISVIPGSLGSTNLGGIRERSVESRLRTLSAMGLAQLAGPQLWDVRRDFESVLRAMQRAADHQKTLTAHGALLSDQRLQLSAPKWRDIKSLEGRVLSHGEGETGNRFLLLEGTDGRVYYLGYTQELDEARARGDLRTKSFVAITKSIDEDHKRRIQIVNFGNAEALLENQAHFQTVAERLIKRGQLCIGDERWNGWLGQYEDRLQNAISDALDKFEEPARSRKVSRGQER